MDYENKHSSFEPRSPFLNEDIPSERPSFPKETNGESWENDSPFFYLAANTAAEPRSVAFQSESNYGAAATREKVRWYQTILQVAAGYPQVPINGKHNDATTKAAMRDFQKKHRLKVSGYLQVDSNLALTQAAIEWIYSMSIANQRGKRGLALSHSIKSFQKEYGLQVDGKVGANTRGIMVKILNRKLPRPRIDFRPVKINSEINTFVQSPVLDHQLIDSDNDTRIPKRNTKGAPNRWVCLLQTNKSIFDIAEPTSAIENKFMLRGGTGFLISPRHVLTAGHIIKGWVDGKKEKQFYKAFEVRVTPGNMHFFTKRRSIQKPFFEFATKKIHTHSQYKKDASNFGNVQNFDHSFDIALIELDKNIDRTSRTITKRINRKKTAIAFGPLGFWRQQGKTIIQAITPQQLNNQTIHLIGYPTKTPKVKTRPKSGWMQWKSSGQVDNSSSIAAKNVFWHTADATNGQSGSPIWIINSHNKKQLVGIHLGWDGSVKANLALAFTEEILQEIQRMASDTFVYKNGVLKVK